MRNKALSGTQIIVSSLDSHDFKADRCNPENFPVVFRDGEEHACAACGGLLTDFRRHADSFEHIKGEPPTFSSSWRTSNELEAKDEEFVCAACDWFLAGNMNRQLFLPVEAYVVFTGEEVLALDAEGFCSFLRKGFQYPCVIAVCDASARLRKNAAWKLNRTVSYSDADAQVSLLSLQRGRKFFCDGTARFSAKQFLPFVEGLVPLAMEYRRKMYDENPKKDARFCYESCLSFLNESFRKRGQMSDEILLAVNIASNFAFPLSERRKKEAVAS